MQRAGSSDLALISEAEQQQIDAAIKAAEKLTSGEIVVVLAAQSDGYGYVPALWASMIALMVPWPLILFTWLPVHIIFIAQLAVFLLIFLATQSDAVRLALVPAALKRNRAHRHAVDQFLVQNLHTTAGRTGVLIFVSAAEKFAEIIADKKIYDRVDKQSWQGIVDELTAHIAKGQEADGFKYAIAEAGRLLAAHFPPGSSDSNELPDHLIVIG